MPSFKLGISALKCLIAVELPFSLAYLKCGSPIVGEVLRCCHERKNPFDRYAIAAMKRLPGRLADCTIGHLPRAISRINRFFLLREGVVSVEIVDKNPRISPIVQGGLEIPVKLMAEIDASEKNEAIMKRLKQLITDNYKEPDVDGKFEDCTEEVLQELIQQDESDDEEQGHALN